MPAANADTITIHVDLLQFLKAFAGGHRVVFEVATELHAMPHPETGRPHVSYRGRQDVLLNYCICLNKGWVQAMEFMQKPLGERPLLVDVVELTASGRDAAGLPPLAVVTPAAAKTVSRTKPVKTVATPSLFGE